MWVIDPVDAVTTVAVRQINVHSNGHLMCGTLDNMTIFEFQRRK